MGTGVFGKHGEVPEGTLVRSVPEVKQPRVHAPPGVPWGNAEHTARGVRGSAGEQLGPGRDPGAASVAMTHEQMVAAARGLNYGER
jgi:hypothetical protein